jgi:hypothetical protein
LQESKLRRGHIGHDCCHEVHATAPGGGYRLKEVSEASVDTVRSRTPHRVPIDVGADDARSWMTMHQRDGDRTAARTYVDRASAVGQYVVRAVRYVLGVRTWNEDSGMDEHVYVTEPGPSHDPGERLASLTTFQQGIEHELMTGSSLEEFPRFIARSDEPASRQATLQRREIHTSDGSFVSARPGRGVERYATGATL